MFIEERHRAILEIIDSKGRITTSEIQEMFDVGYETAKRDLRILEQKGLLKRTYGGAVPVTGYAVGKPAGITCRDYTEVKPDYLAVAKRAAGFVENGDVIFITAATVGWFMLGFLPQEYKLRIVVNSTILAEELRKNKNYTVVMLGGELDEKGNSYGMYARDMLRGMRIDKAFVTSAYISPSFGLSVQSENRAEFLRLVFDCSRNVYGLYPTAKIGAESAISICPAYRLHTLITDSDAAEEDIAAFADLDVDVVVAEIESE